MRPMPARRTITTTAAFAMIAVAMQGLVSCKPPPAPPATSLVVRAHAETGTAVSNVAIISGGSLVASTDPAGIAQLDVVGAEGATYDLEIRCPKGFRSPAAPLSVRRLSIAATTDTNRPEYAVTCHTTRHHLVVAVRADGGANLPILYMGRQVAKTDRSGAAHVLIDADVHERVELTLDTRVLGKEAEKIHPRNPTASFEMLDRDDIQSFDVTFTRDPKKKPPPPPPKNPGPVIIQ